MFRKRRLIIEKGRPARSWNKLRTGRVKNVPEYYGM
jgi:hypothetical protein